VASIVELRVFWQPGSVLMFIVLLLPFEPKKYRGDWKRGTGKQCKFLVQVSWTCVTAIMQLRPGTLNILITTNFGLGYTAWYVQRTQACYSSRSATVGLRAGPNYS